MDQNVDDVKTMGPGGDGPEEARKEDMETLVDGQDRTCESTDGATSSLTLGDDDSHYCQISPFMLGAIRQLRRFPPSGIFCEGAIVPYCICPGKSTMNVADWTYYAG